MSLYRELASSIEETMEKADETQEFKNRLSKLIENDFDNSTLDSDISELIELVKNPEEQRDGH